MPFTSLRIFGSIHTDRLNKVQTELKNFIDDVDDVFVEQPDPKVGWNKRTYVSALIKAPLFFVGMTFLSSLFYPIYLVFNRAPRSTEVEAIRNINPDEEMNVYHVDLHPIQIMAKASLPWILGNWIGLIVIALFWKEALVLSIITGITGWLLHLGIYSFNHHLWMVLGIFITLGVYILFFGGVLSIIPVCIFILAYVITASVTAKQRENHIVSRISEISDEQEIKEGCIVIGKAHLDNIQSIINDTNMNVDQVFSSSWLRRSRK